MEKELRALDDILSELKRSLSSTELLNDENDNIISEDELFNYANERTRPSGELSFRMEEDESTYPLLDSKMNTKTTTYEHHWSDFDLEKTPRPPSPLRIGPDDERKLYDIVGLAVFNDGDLPPPLPPPRKKSLLNQATELETRQEAHEATVLPGSKQNVKENDQPDEMVFEEDDEDLCVKKELQDQAKRMSQMINFQDVMNEHQDDQFVGNMKSVTGSKILQDIERVGEKRRSIDTEEFRDLKQRQIGISANAIAKNSHSDKLTSRDDHNLLPTSESKQKRVDGHVNINLVKIQKVAVRIYIENAKTFKTIVITSLMTAIDVTHDIIRKSMLETGDDWTLFELNNNIGIERPLRDYEIIKDIILNWNTEITCALLLKRYSYRDSLNLTDVDKKYPSMCGWLYVEFKSGKWQRKFCEISPDGMYYAADSKLLTTSRNLLSSISCLDVYTLMRAKKKAPTKFCFAISGATLSDEKESSVVFVCAESLDKMKDWILSIRHFKSKDIAKIQNIDAKNSKSGEKGSLSRKKSQRSKGSSGIKKHTGPDNQHAQPTPSRKMEKSDDKKLVEIIQQIQGKFEPNAKEIVNRTIFGDNGAALVPLTEKDLHNIPGIDISKYSTKVKERTTNSTTPCSTCGCLDFARNPFNEHSCANCFHIHR